MEQGRRKRRRTTNLYDRDCRVGDELGLVDLVTVTSGDQKISRTNEQHLETKEQQKSVIPALCEEEPSYVNQGAVKNRNFSRPGYPVVIKYECDQMAKEKYKYISGPKEALCDSQGNWTLPAMFCIPTSCFITIVDRNGGKSALYGGDIHKTKDGRECQDWKGDKPQHPHIRNKLYGCTGCGSMKDIGNKCRAPDEVKPWCYIMNRIVRWQYCYVRKCTKERICARPPTLHGAPAVRTDVIGQKVHVTYRCHSKLKYIGGRNVSICDMETGVWEWPDLLCASEDCFYFDKDQWGTSVYLGNVSTTKTGIPCQRWASQTPHHHTRTASGVPGASSLYELGNLCRDPVKQGAPWCYTTNPAVKWEACAVPECLI